MKWINKVRNMRALWWFEEGQIAGMARPGFNCTHFFDYPYDEAVLMGWLGLFSTGHAPREDFITRMETYCPKVAPFFGVGEEENQKLMETFRTKAGLLDVLSKISKRAKHLKSFDVTDTDIHFEYCGDRLNDEMEHLKSLGIKSIVSLTEDHHNRDELSENFETHHFSIFDLDAPSMEQVTELSEIIKKSKQDKEAVAVHCLAGIGRTSTMLIASHLILGESLESLKTLVERQNPTYKLTGRQKEIIESVQSRLNSQFSHSPSGSFD